MRATFIAACALALAPLLAFAQEKTEQKTKLPWNPFATAKEGDWESLVMKTVPGQKAPPMAAAVVWKVKEVAQGKATVAIDSRAGVGTKAKPGAEADKSFTAGPDMTLEDYLGLEQRHETPTDVKVEQERKTVHGNEFACTKISYTAKLPVVDKEGKPERVLNDRTTLWISKDVRSYGLVALETELRVKGDDGEPDLTMEFEIAGYGRGEKVEWGKKLEDVELPTPRLSSPDPVKPAEEMTRLPFKLFDDAKLGDWEALLTTVTDSGKVTKSVLVYRITTIDEACAEVAGELMLPDGTKKRTAGYTASLLAPAVEVMLGVHANAKTESVDFSRSKIALEDATRKVGGKEFSCTKATLTSRTETKMPDGTLVQAQSDAVWFTKDARVGGIVALVQEDSWTSSGADHPDRTRKIEMEIVGFGRQGTVEWGKKPEDIELAPK